MSPSVSDLSHVFCSFLLSLCPQLAHPTFANTSLHPDILYSSFPSAAADIASLVPLAGPGPSSFSLAATTSFAAVHTASAATSHSIPSARPSLFPPVLSLFPSLPVLTQSFPECPNVLSVFTATPATVPSAPFPIHHLNPGGVVRWHWCLYIPYPFHFSVPEPTSSNFKRAPTGGPLTLSSTAVCLHQDLSWPATCAGLLHTQPLNAILLPCYLVILPHLHGLLLCF